MKKEKISLFGLWSLGVGGTIGTGIFVMLGYGIGETGRSASLALIVGCIYMLLAYWYQPVMASMFVLKGGDYDMKAMLYGPVMTGVVAIFGFLSFSFGYSSYGIALAEYAGVVFPGIAEHTTLFAVVVTILFFLAVIKGNVFVSKLNNVMTIALVISLALFIVVGLPKVQPGYLTNDGFFLAGPTGFILAISLMSSACQGGTYRCANLMADIENPKKTAPKAMFLIVLTVAILYALVGVVATGVLPIEQVANQNLSSVARTIFSTPLFYLFILGGACCAIATTLLSGLASIRHMMVRIADDGWVPAFFKKKTANGYPWAIQVFVLIMTLLPIVTKFSVAEVVSLLQLGNCFMNAFLSFGLIKLVKQYPQQWKASTLHMPMPLFTVLTFASMVCNLLVTYTLLKNLSMSKMLLSIGMMLFCAVLAALRLKTGAVNGSALIERRAKIAEAALNADDEAI